MKTFLLFFIMIFLVFPSYFMKAQDEIVDWNTFLGGATGDYGHSIALDGTGKLYITGLSESSWGSPVNAHSGGTDIFIACLNSSGSLLWNTFLGSGGQDFSHGITLDGSGNIYIIGNCNSGWGSPVNSFSGDHDVCVVCLNGSGSLVWNTFLGSAGYDYNGYGIGLDGSGNIYFTGSSEASWGSPVNAHSGGWDIFAACLNSSGVLQWNTFLGSSGGDYGYDTVLNDSGQIYVTGLSSGSWGSPVNTHSGFYDAFVAALDDTGNLVWNTFMGSVESDAGYGIALDSGGNIYVAGYSLSNWGSPVNGHSGTVDGFAACLDSSGILQWNTFFGSTTIDYSHDIVVDSSGLVYVTGRSDSTWGKPVNGYNGGYDMFVTGLDASGDRNWNTFVGSTGDDWGEGILLDGSNSIYLTGYSDTGWGFPVNAHSGGYDALVAKLTLHPLADITANGKDGPVTISQSNKLKIRISLFTFGLTDQVDLWLVYEGPSGWVHYNNTTKIWETGLGVTHQGALFKLNNKKVFQSSELTPGNYTFYFGVDMVMDGKVTKSSLYKDEVQITVTSN